MIEQAGYTTPEPERSALLTIDVQEDFTRPGAPAEIRGTWDRLPAMQRLVEAYRKHRLPIVHVVRLYAADGANADLCRRESIENGSRLVVPGSAGAELMEVLKPDVALNLDADTLLSGKLQRLGEKEWVMYKPRWDAFYQTPLDLHLRHLGVTTVVVAGCNFPNCPRATIYGASMRDFRIVLISDAVSRVYEQGLAELRSIGVAALPSAEYLGTLSVAIERPNLLS
ncbi:MAG TPA: isochorismatase family cysteine hydrolase [Bryobacteraceae bacterium]|jgi:nicotinamidase-related amidase|nr:isochorismatase family cysteine hydrolase [Bryobacteraceae bacterium]